MIGHSATAVPGDIDRFIVGFVGRALLHGGNLRYQSELAGRSWTRQCFHGANENHSLIIAIGAEPAMLKLRSDHEARRMKEVHGMFEPKWSSWVWCFRVSASPGLRCFPCWTIKVQNLSRGYERTGSRIGVRRDERWRRTLIRRWRHEVHPKEALPQ